MEDRVVLVTGAGRGIGRAIARKLLAEGAAVVLAEKDEALGRAAAEALSPLGHVLFVPTDVTDEDQVLRAVDAAVERFGHLYGLVNNAAIASNCPLSQLSRHDFERVLAVNLTGPFLMAQAAAPHLKRSKGAIVQIASSRALMSEPGTEAYSASKGGLIALTHALAASLAPEVRVNCISPGWIDVRDEGAPLSDEDHRQHWVGRVGTPDDIADAVSFLLSHQAGFITGANLVIDGGMTRKMIYAEG